ncbi:MAG: hypothetical protein ACO36E_07025 [Synechocystis sp.]
MHKKAIKQLLETVLLKEGEMVHGLYEYELAENIDYLKKSLKQDNDDYIFTVTTNNGDAAMLLIDNQDKIFINEAARDELKRLWQKNYTNNIKKLIPDFVAQLTRDELPINGVKTVSSPKKGRRTWSLPRTN